MLSLKFSFTFLFFFISVFLNAQDSLWVNNINIQGNNITKEKIILRELVFQEGDIVTPDKMDMLVQKSRENLLNTSLFNFVTINYTILGNTISFTIDVQERWYIWPYPILEHADRNLSSFIRNQEWSRVDYGIYGLVNNFRGRKEVLKLKLIFGYNNSIILHYFIPYIDKYQRVGLGFEVDYWRNHEIPFDVKNDELEYLKMMDRYLLQTTQASAFLRYRPGLYISHLFDLKYSHVDVDDTISQLNPDYLYDNRNNLELLSFVYSFDFDKRDSKVYPLKGFRFNTSLKKNGLGIFSNYDDLELKAILEQNSNLYSKLYFQMSVFGFLKLQNQKSYFFSEAIGYKNYIRGMEYYVTNGTDYYISKSNLKFEILPQTKLDLNFIPSDKFSKAHYALYLNLFFDTGYVSSSYNMNNFILNEFLYSGGVGIDLVTYYDKVLRIEYSLNKFGEHGIFFHLGAPIIEN